MIIDPEKLGLTKPKIKDIQISNKDQAINAFISVLNNTANNAMIEITALNAAGGLMVANIAKNFEEGIEIALNTIKNGDVLKLLENFVRAYGDITKLKEFE